MITQADAYEIDELHWLNEIQYDEIWHMMELLDNGRGELMDRQEAILILTTLRRVFEQYNGSLNSLQDYKQFKHWAYWTYGVRIRGTNSFYGNDPQMIEVSIIPRKVFDAIKYGGLTVKELKVEFPELRKKLEWMIPRQWTVADIDI